MAFAATAGKSSQALAAESQPSPLLGADRLAPAVQPANMYSCSVQPRFRVVASSPERSGVHVQASSDTGAVGVDVQEVLSQDLDVGWAGT